MTLIIEEPDLSEILRQEMIEAVRKHDENRPRSRQVAVGASEIGSPCDRQLALKSLGFTGGNKPDPWASIIGTSVHVTLAGVFSELGHVTERSVDIAPGMRGTADLYLAHHKTVVDHKVPADSTMAKVRKKQITPAYRVQGQLYGLGFTKLGYDVENVALAFWPRGAGAWLGGLTVVVDPYDPAVAERALERWFALVLAAVDLDLEQVPENAKYLATADGPCAWCPFFDPQGKSAERIKCTGHK
jgi:hypothetical protein